MLGLDDGAALILILLLYLTNNNGIIITAMKGAVIYAKYQTYLRFKELQ